MWCRTLVYFSTLRSSAIFFVLFKTSMSCVKVYWVFGGFTLLPPSNFSLQPSRGLRLTGFNHAWLSHTLNHAVASLIVCYYPLCIAIRKALPPSPPPLLAGEASRHALDEPVLLCAATQRGKRGGPSQVCLLSPRCKLTQKKTLSGSVGCLPGFLSTPVLPLSSEQWPEELTRVARRGGNRGVGGTFLFKLLGNMGPLCPRHPQFYAPANQPSMLMWLWRVETDVLSFWHKMKHFEK